jgi:hypothetical protein
VWGARRARAAKRGQRKHRKQKARATHRNAHAHKGNWVGTENRKRTGTEKGTKKWPP